MSNHIPPFTYYDGSTSYASILRRMKWLYKENKELL